MDDSSITSPSPEHDMDRPKSNSSAVLTEMAVPSEADEQSKAMRRVDWPIKEGTKLGPFSARIAVVQEDCVKENSICVRGSSKSLFSIFILEYYTEEMLIQTNIRPASVNGPKAAIVYIYKPDKQLYLLTLKDVEEHENIPTVFLEGGQDRHPGSMEVDDLLRKEVAAETVHKSSRGASSPAGSFPSPSEGASPKIDLQSPTSPNETAGIQEPLGVPSVSCQSCGVTFRNPANLSAHQLYYCAARETTPVPPSTRSRPPRHSSTPREAYAANQAAFAKETGKPEDLVCILCKARFSNLTNCLSHMIKLHTEQNSQACKCCNFISVDVKLLKEHMLIHVRGSGINPNIFMASQGSHALMGPLAFHGPKDRRLEEKRKRKKHHQAPGSQTLTAPHEDGGSSSSALEQDQTDQTDVTKSRSVKGSEHNGVLTTGSINAEPEPSQSTSKSRCTPPTSSSDLGKVQNELQTRPIGRFLCVECDIYFSSHKNFVAHKQFYCQGHTKERKQTGHVQIPPLPTPSVPLVQCGNCGAVFPSRDKLAVHTLYFCHCRKPGKISAQDSEALPDKSCQQGRSSPNEGTGSHDEEGDKTKSDNSKTKEDSSANPHIKVEPDEGHQGNDKDHTQSVTENEHVSPNASSFKVGTASSGLSPGSVLLAPGNMPTYIGRQGNSPVYIVASHVFVTPPGENGSRGVPQAPYPPFSAAIPVGRELVLNGKHGTPIPGERPLDLTVRKRKGSDESVSEGGSASKVLKNEPVDQKSTASSPTSQSDIASSILPPFNLPNFPGHVQYKCPGCHIAFNRLESLDIHRQFYCQSDSGSGNQTPVLHPSTSIPVHTTLPALPYYQIVSNPSPANGSALVPALATVNLRDNHSATSESKGNEGSPSLSKGRSSSSPVSEAMEGVSTSSRTSPSYHESDSKENKIDDQVKGTKIMHLHSSKSSETTEMRQIKGSSPSTPSMSPTIPGSPKNITRYLGSQNGESGESGGQNIPLYVPSVVRYMCPACGVSFMKLESLSAHQHFYCRASQEALSSDGGSARGKGIVSSDSIPRTSSLTPRSSSRCSDSAPISEISRPSSGHVSRSEPSVAMDTGEKADTGEAAQGQLNGSNVQAALTRSEKCDDSGNESRTSLSPDDSAHDNASGIDVKCKESRKKNDGSCKIKIKEEKEEDSYDASTNTACSITDNNNMTHVKLEKLDDGSCCSGSEKLLPKSCRQENGTKETGTMYNGCHSPGDEDGKLPQTADSTESSSPASPPSGMNGSRQNGSGATAGAAGRPAPVMLKHCRSCNISFSSLSTFIAHKKYYCASHHVAKNPVH
ncbi:zinc finger protein ZFPM1-like [Lytechinus variegatus]|uniref:zinc finger protein ZFPM1-like n=1 Tax=Lytechinus variegatus TaxID=7654 RepID=UPI001BB134AD|nr:zinc finger protein ZFPM1-like [Lytechinus variegatus]